MATPCKKCGAEKTESIGHGLLYALAKAFGYRLRICSRCHRYRLLPRYDEKPHRSDEKPHHHHREEPKRSDAPKVEGACPECGKSDFRRSRRRWWERLIMRGPMVRCRACHTRFPMPQPTPEGED
jgi:hypothetical protein